MVRRELNRDGKARTQTEAGEKRRNGKENKHKYSRGENQAGKKIIDCNRWTVGMA